MGPLDSIDISMANIGPNQIRIPKIIKIEKRTSKDLFKRALIGL